jgi:tetratricopeptide (TPR) repeat protein
MMQSKRRVNNSPAPKCNTGQQKTKPGLQVIPQDFPFSVERQVKIPAKTPKPGMALVIGIGLAAVLTHPLPAQSAETDPSAPVNTCPRGKVWSGSLNRCVTIKSEKLNDEERYAQAFNLAKSGQYAQAITILKTIKNQKDPKVLTYLGYSNRKMGNMAQGVKYYKQALAIDPDFVKAREYLGEGYVAAGKVTLAKQQLAEIKTRCGTSCEEYKGLAAAIKAGRPNSW